MQLFSYLFYVSGIHVKSFHGSRKTEAIATKIKIPNTTIRSHEYLSNDNSPHYVKSLQIRSFLWSVFPVFGLNKGKHRPERTTYLDTFHTVPSMIYESTSGSGKRLLHPVARKVILSLLVNLLLYSQFCKTLYPN